MAQADYSIANQAGAAFRSEINDHLSAIVSQNSGTTEPSATFAYQWWADTTTGILKQRNAANSAWINILTLSTGAAKSLDGTVSSATTGTTQSAGDNSTKVATTAYVDAYVPAIRGFIDGLIMSTAGSSATMTISAGQAADSTNAVMMSLGSAISKTTSAWAVGTGNGGKLSAAAIANNTWYYFFEIRRPDTGVVDIGFDVSATTPTMPTNYTQYRYIGAALTNGSAQWTRFFQNGDTFLWDTPVLDVDATTGTTAALSTLTVPRGRKMRALFNIYASDGTSGAGRLYISDPEVQDLAPSNSVAPLATITFNGAASDYSSCYAECFTDTSAQIRRRGVNATNYCRLATLGWIDQRGRNA